MTNDEEFKTSNGVVLTKKKQESLNFLIKNKRPITPAMGRWNPDGNIVRQPTGGYLNT